MYTSSSFYKRAKFWRWFLLLGFFFIFLFSFWEEIITALKGAILIIIAISSYGFDLLNAPLRAQVFTNLGFDESHMYAIWLISINIIFYFAVAWFALFNVVKFVLPVRTRKEHWKAFWRILRYQFGKHGPAILVKEGQKISTQLEMKKIHPGVALVDLSSAIVLEQQNTRQIQRWQEEKLGNENGGQFIIFLKKLLKKLQGKPLPWIRVFGPGVIFTEKGEKVHSILDLRTQVRSQSDVQAFTRDGIELKNPVSVVFSLSDAPEVIPVAYIGGQEQSNLYGLELGEPKEDSTLIKEYFELDPEDAAEIHQFVQFGTHHEENHLTNRSSQQPLFKTPYPFHDQRIFAATFAQAHAAKKLTPWDELPLQVAIDIYRKELEKYNFDEIQRVDNLTLFPLKRIKDKFAFRMRFQGMISYKLIKSVISSEDSTEDDSAWNEHPFKFSDVGEDGIIWSNTELRISSPHALMRSKVLRDRGIKIIAAGFPELRVAENSLRQNLIDSWKARWEREIDITRAQHELEAKREEYRTRAQTQREMTYVISNLFRTTGHSKEALALRIFQALERGAANGLPSREVLSMLQSLYRWLLTQRKEFERRSRANKQHWVGGTSPDNPEAPQG